MQSQNEVPMIVTAVEGYPMATTAGLLQAPAAKGKAIKPRKDRAKEGSFRLAQLGMSGEGFVKVVKEAGFGFISVPELDEQLFFHASELVHDEPEGGPPKPFLESIFPGDEVQFIVGQNTGSRLNFVAQKVRKLPAHTVKATIVSPERFVGRVTTELNSGNWRSQDSAIGKITFTQQPEVGAEQQKVIDFQKDALLKPRQPLKTGDLVQFQIRTVNHENIWQAVNVELIKETVASLAEEVLHGFIKEISKTGGIIRCVEQDKRFSFRISEMVQAPAPTLRKGQEVMFSVVTDAKDQGKIIRLDPLPEGSLEAERDMGMKKGRVARSVGANRGGGHGLLVIPELPGIRALFNADTSCADNAQPSSLEVDDEVAFRLMDHLRIDVKTAKDLQLLCKGSDRRELGQVRTKKSNFGFIACCQRSGQLFFHASAMTNCSFEDIKKGDDVEFTVERNPERGTMAVRVKQVASGSAVFETVSEQKFKGVVAAAPSTISPGFLSSGLIDFVEDGLPSKMLFSANDFQEEARIGDHVSFQIADNENAARQVESLGCTASRMIGRHATNGKVTRLQGVVRQALQGFGFIESKDQDATSDKRFFYHTSEVVDQVELGVGDTVSFILTKGPKMREDLARKVVRTAVAPSVPTKVEEDPVRVTQKPVSNLAPPVRIPAMPDGTKGFHMGRGRGIQPATATATVPVQVPGKLLTKLTQTAKLAANLSNQEQAKSQRGRKPPKKKPSSAVQANAAVSPANGQSHKAAPARSFSGNALNPNAAEFQPRTST